jgi:hypothetical protein
VGHPLDACRLKLGRAYEQGEALGRELGSFLRRNPYGKVQEFDADTNDCVLSHCVFEEPPALFGILIGEFVHNVSSALEQLAWQLVILNGRKPKEGVTGFPIFESETKYKSRASNMVRGMSAMHRAMVERAQPYHAADPEAEPLAVLRQLWNQDKHRLLTTTMAVPGRIELRFHPFQDVESIVNVEGFPGPLKHGAPLARVKVVPFGRNPKVVMDGETAIGVAFAEGEPAAGQFVDATMTAIYRNVDAIVRVFLMDFPL